MALNWQWTDKMGKCIYKNGYTVNLYKGNALMIAVAEDEKQYSLSWFICDKEHFKNMLGLSKGITENSFQEYDIDTLVLDTSYSDVPAIVQLLAKAKTKIKIELI